MRSAAARAARRHPAHVALAAVVAGLAASPAGAELALALAALLAAALTAAGTSRLALACAALALAGAGVGEARLAALGADEARLRAAGAVRIEATAHLLERPRATRYASAAALRIASGPAAGMRLHARLGGGAAWPREARPGTEVRVAGRARPLADGARAGERDFDLAAQLRREGVAGELVIRRIAATGRRRGGLAGVLDRARDRSEAALAAGLGAREAALARGFVLGQDEAVDPLLRQDFRDAGLAHLLAVSGQNVMLLCALALPLVALTGAGIPTRVAVLLVLIAAYVPLAGAGPSLQRAAVMGAAGLVALAAGRPASRWYALLLAAAVTLALQPRIAGDPGWQLSFAAVIGIALVAPPLRRVALAVAEPFIPARGRGRRLAGAVAEGAAVTIAATVATLPLLSLHFGSVPVAGVPANLAALPAVAPVMWIGMVQAALGQLHPLPLAGDAADVAVGVLALPGGALLRWIAAVAVWSAANVAPLAVRLAPAQAAVAYAALAVLSVLAGRAVRRRGRTAAGWTAHAGAARSAWRALPPATRVGVWAAIACAIVATAARAPAAPSRLTVSFLDVGQGDATLIQDPGGATILFDGGPPEARVVRLLRRAGVRRLDLVVATHASRDHHGGLAEVVRELPVGTLLDGGDGTADPAFREMLEIARAEGARVVPASAGMAVRAGDVAVRVLSPPPRPAGPPPEDPNPRAVVAVVSSGGFDLLLSADAESGALLPLALPDVDAMKVPHHGSADPGLGALLARVRPEIAAIPVGDNDYGHPAPSTLAALEAHVPHVLRTDEHGTIRLEVSAGRARVRTGP